jgi:ribonuclease P protein subunit POP4
LKSPKKGTESAVEPEYDNKNIVLQELIGLRVSVKSSKDAGRRGISGVVLDETKSTILIKKSDKIVRVPKIGTVFSFRFGRKSFIVDGKEINFRPHERISKGLKFYKARSV